MNTENNQQLNQTQQSYQEDEIDLRELLSILWKGKWIIIGITFIFAVASVAYALYLPNEYKATVVLQPNKTGSGGKLASLAGQFGGLASMAGINLGSGESSDALIAMEVMKSWGFAEKFINEHNLSVPLFAVTEWNENTNELIYDEEVYDPNSQKWTREPPKGKTIEPTSWELFKKFKEKVSISQDKETGLVNISVIHYSPAIAKQWVDWLVIDINKLMKERDLKEANKSIQYLEEQFKITSYAELRKMFSELIQEQHKTKMLAQVSEEYVFKTVSKAKVPEEKDKPKRAIIAVLGTFLGGVLSVFLVLVLSWVRNSKQNRE